MMTYEMFEEMFEGLCIENNVTWYDTFEGDLLEMMCEEIARCEGLEIGNYDSWAEMLDHEMGGDFSRWYCDMCDEL